MTSQNPDFSALFNLPTGLGNESRLLGSFTALPVVDLWLRFGTEYLRFVSQRLAAQAELLDKLRHCTNVDELVRTETRFLDTATDDYGQALDRMADVTRADEPAVAQPRKKGAKVVSA